MGGDGDPPDALVLVGEPMFPGCRIRGRIVGVFDMRDEERPDEKDDLRPGQGDGPGTRVNDVQLILLLSSERDLE